MRSAWHWVAVWPLLIAIIVSTLRKGDPGGPGKQIGQGKVGDSKTQVPAGELPAAGGLGVQTSHSAVASG